MDMPASYNPPNIATKKAISRGKNIILKIFLPVLFKNKNEAIKTRIETKNDINTYSKKLYNTANGKTTNLIIYSPYIKIKGINNGKLIINNSTLSTNTIDNKVFFGKLHPSSISIFYLTM